MITVRIGGNEFPLDDVLEEPGRYARQLERAKTVQGFAECGCGSRRPRPKLVIRRPRDIFLLARWPEQAHLHAEGCPFNRQALAKSGAGDNLDPFRMKEGHHDIRLDASLSVSAHTPAASVRRATTSLSTKPQRRSAGLLAFLEYAWEQAGLNVWPGTGSRGWNACWSQLTTELADCRINGKPADGLLHVMQRWDQERKTEILAEFEAWQARLAPTKAGNPRGIVMGRSSPMARPNTAARLSCARARSASLCRRTSTHACRLLSAARYPPLARTTNVVLRSCWSNGPRAAT